MDQLKEEEEKKNKRSETYPVILFFLYNFSGLHPTYQW
jgi:hypothetical protein